MPTRRPIPSEELAAVELGASAPGLGEFEPWNVPLVRSGNRALRPGSLHSGVLLVEVRRNGYGRFNRLTRAPGPTAGSPLA